MNDGLSVRDSSFIQKVIANDTEFRAELLELKTVTPYYPIVIRRVYLRKHQKESIISTFVRIKRDEVWYRIHVVERYYEVIYEKKNDVDIDSLLLMSVMRSAHKIFHLYRINSELTESYEIDPCQIDEKDRLITLIEQRFL